jgi:hypothetical protein
VTRLHDEHRERSDRGDQDGAERRVHGDKPELITAVVPAEDVRSGRHQGVSGSRFGEGRM